MPEKPNGVSGLDPPDWDYETAFSRNIGWVSRDEQAVLRHSRVAVAGVGGVGGSHIMTMARLGIGAFNIADPDLFDLPNFNRQAGAFRSTLCQSKCDVLLRMARDVNPGLQIGVFREGVTPENLDAFLADVDVYVDGLDFFEMAMRQRVFAACRERGIPAITAAPFGMGAALLVFMPQGMSYERYFGLEGRPEEEQLLRFLVGLAPSLMHRGYLMEPGAVNLAEHRGPSTAMACELCAGIAATHVLKVLLHRGELAVAPHGVHFDAYRNRFRRTWRPGGYRNPRQQLVIALGRRQLHRIQQHPPPPGSQEPAVDRASAPARASPAHRVLEFARWAPSGDNSQPWRFEIRNDHRLTVHGHDTRESCLYDLQGRASQFALGGLLETLEIAAAGHGFEARMGQREGMPETQPTFDVTLEPVEAPPLAPLFPWIRMRAVRRTALSPRKVGLIARRRMEAALGPRFRVLWLDGLGQRLRMASLLYRNAGLRLRVPEAFDLHRDIIAWDSWESEDRIPDRALGVDPLTRRLMRSAMASARRLRLLNRYLGASILPRLEMEVIPALLCGAHFVIAAERPPATVDDYVDAGRATQRFWLTAARLGLQLQPAYTPLVFAEYARGQVAFTADAARRAEADDIRGRLERVLGADTASAAVFLGRVGYGKPAASRSTRQSLEALLVPATPAESDVPEAGP